MVNSNLSSASSSTALQHNSGVTSAAAEEGCNDEPPPIPSPPAGNPAGGVTHHIISGGDNRSLKEGIWAINGDVQDPKVHDYGSPDGICRLDSLTATTTTSTTATSPAGGLSRSSTQSSLTAVDAVQGDSVITISHDASFEGWNSHTTSPEAIATALGVSLIAGLNTHEAEERLARDGPNTLTSDGGVTWYGVLLRQVSNSLTLVSSRSSIHIENKLYAFLL